jgi:hypothetical protein
LTVTALTQVGDTVLQPGEYEVTEANSPSGPVIEFVHQFRNELASELVQADEQEVVARVQFTEEVLRSPTKSTELIRSSNSVAPASGLQIRGSEVRYAFARSQIANKAETTAVCANVGQQ